MCFLQNAFANNKIALFLSTGILENIKYILLKLHYAFEISGWTENNHPVLSLYAISFGGIYFHTEVCTGRVFVDLIQILYAFHLCYFHGTIPSGKILWSHPFPFKVSIDSSRVCKIHLAQFGGKIQTQNTKRVHLCNDSALPPWEALWPCLADLPSATLYVWYSPPWPSFMFPPPSLCKPGNPASSTDISLQPPNPAFCWCISRRYVTCGKLGLRGGCSTAEAQNFLPLSSGVRSLGRHTHLSCMLVSQLLHPVT